jgi:hypothetical protein
MVGKPLPPFTPGNNFLIYPFGHNNANTTPFSDVAVLHITKVTYYICPSK